MTTRIWVSPEQAEILDTPILDCYHGRSYLTLMHSDDSKHGVLFCAGCGTFFNFLGHTDASVTSEAKAIEINKERVTSAQKS